jgi:CheY-like chemotaxis protein
MAGKKILVADDSLTIQKVIRLALSGDGYEIQTVSNGREAIEQASLFRPDICIVDVSLPGYDAYQVREKFLQKPDLKNIPIIMMSSAFEKVDESKMNQLGFMGHLVKPFDPSHLRSTLLSVIHRAPENDPVLATINEPTLPPPGPISFQEPSILHSPQPSTSGFEEFPPLSTNPMMDDIQALAKNTFEMSGLDQHDWGMLEPGKADFAPEPEVSAIDLNTFNEPKVTTNPYAADPLSPAVGSMDTSIGNVTLDEIQTLIRAEVARVLEEMHFQIQDKVTEEMKRATDDFIPNLAERMIREEIHKLLTNPPV